GLTPLRPGELSRAFAFDAGGERYVVRFNARGAGFAKDRLAHERFAAPDLPIPRVHEIGHYGDLNYCISERLRGTPTLYLSPDLLPRCPEERQVVHGDYGYDNVLAEHGRVTGVLDWEALRYGDPLYDVAYLQLYLPGNEGIVDRTAYPDHDARLATYLLYIAL